MARCPPAPGSDGGDGAPGRAGLANTSSGLEGGLDVVHEGASADEMLRHSRFSRRASRVFLESWAYVSDGRARPLWPLRSIELPEALAHEVLENGV